MRAQLLEAPVLSGGPAPLPQVQCHLAQLADVFDVDALDSRQFGGLIQPSQYLSEATSGQLCIVDKNKCLLCTSQHVRIILSQQVRQMSGLDTLKSGSTTKVLADPP